jgi:hypothetical protein
MATGGLEATGRRAGARTVRAQLPHDHAQENRMLPDLPLFPDMTPLELAHKPLLDALFAMLQPRVSEFTFTNLYIWRHAYGLQITRFEDDTVALLALRSDPEESFLLAPLGERAGAAHVAQCLQWMADAGHEPRLIRMDQSLLDRLGLTEDDWSIESDRANWDYVYRVRELVELDPERYPEKARHYEQFARRYAFAYSPITPELIPGCIELQDLWCDDKHCDLYSNMRAEARAVKETLAQMDELGVQGGAILVRNRVQAFTLAEPLSRDTLVIHIEKASPDLHGAFQVINREFLRHDGAGWEYANREQDVGDPGLRKAKESYLPALMVEKFQVRRK